jgi:hypothetical protein
MNGLDACITSKVPIIESQNPLNAAYSHRGGQPCIMDLNARHAIRDKEFPPLFMHRQAVGKQSELFFKEFRAPVCFLRGKSVAVAVERAGTVFQNSPTFCEV